VLLVVLYSTIRIRAWDVKLMKLLFRLSFSMKCPECDEMVGCALGCINPGLALLIKPLYYNV
jgi:hypothetical protein